MNQQILEEIGLTKGEIAVYYSLIELGSSTAGPIIKKAKISPSKIYDILNRLMEKGLVSFIVRENRKYFEAAPPTRILDYISEKEERLKKQRELAKKIIPSLELKQHLTAKQSNVTVYLGIKGIKTAFLRAKQETKKEDKYLGLFIPRVDNKLVSFFEEFTKEFCREIGKTQMLFNEPSPELDRIRSINGVKVKLLSEQFRVPTEICIIGNNVLISTTAGMDFMSILITNKEMADSFRKHFELLWSISSK